MQAKGLTLEGMLANLLPSRPQNLYCDPTASLSCRQLHTGCPLPAVCTICERTLRLLPAAWRLGQAQIKPDAFLGPTISKYMMTPIK